MKARRVGAESDTEGLIDSIYEAALVPQRWLELLETLARRIDAVAGSLFCVRDGVVHSLSTPSFEGIMACFAREGWAERNLRAPRAAALRYPGFVTDHDLVTEEEMRSHPFYTELLHRFGFGYATGTVIMIPNGDSIVLNLERQRSRGPVERHHVAMLDTLRPHLARAALMTTRLALQEARAAVAALGRLGLPAAMLGARGQVLAGNDELWNLAQVGVRGQGQLVFSDPAAQKVFTHVLEGSRGPTRSCSLALRAAGGAPRAVAHLIPVRGIAQEVFLQASVLVVVTPLSAPGACSAELLGALFDLTPAEARLARAIAAGETLTGMAAELRLSRETLRTQLKAVFEKTGTRRQAELVGLLAKIAGTPAS